MPAPETRYHHRAFTLLELLVVVAVIVLLLAIFPAFPAYVHDHRQSSAIGCMSNLKQIGMGFILYENDHGGMPWRISTRDGGTQELIQNGVAADHFTRLTNIGLEPTDFVCPSDKVKRASLTGFTELSNSNLSYFLSLDFTNHQAVLAGDRHLSLDGKPLKPGLFKVAAGVSLGWTRELHSTARRPLGNLLFADAHVETVRTDELTSKFDVPTGFTNRLVIP